MTRGQWGGRRPGAGPHRRRLTLSKKSGENLAQLTKRWREARNNPDMTEEAIVEELIEIALQQDVPPAPPLS
ncbi:MAG TPA: hypothetical protein VFA10_30120 [Ktedonobacteraceae bacterium]|nr:hypothetical protein [Ktedonobacteraceae bacterium]